ncbi:MAG: winged helix-turn-helix transcriptional regulator [Thermoplasmataceae archaeon]
MDEKPNQKVISNMSSSDCPIVESIKLIGGEWNLIIIRHLSDGSKGFNAILKAANGISPRTLSRSLKYLEESGFVVRNVISTRPFRVEYELTEKGKALKSALVDLRKWGEKWAMPDK